MKLDEEKFLASANHLLFLINYKYQKLEREIILDLSRANVECLFKDSSNNLWLSANFNNLYHIWLLDIYNPGFNYPGGSNNIILKGGIYKTNHLVELKFNFMAATCLDKTIKIWNTKTLMNTAVLNCNF